MYTLFQEYCGAYFVLLFTTQEDEVICVSDDDDDDDDDDDEEQEEEKAEEVVEVEQVGDSDFVITCKILILLRSTLIADKIM